MDGAFSMGDTMAPEHTDMTGAARLREALEEIARHPTTERNPDGEDQAAWTMQLIAREALAAVPEAPEPVYEWRVCGEHMRYRVWGNERQVRMDVTDLTAQGRRDLRIERRTAPGPWERVEEGTE